MFEVTSSTVPKKPLPVTKRVVLLVSVMSVLVLAVDISAIGMLYHTALQEERLRLAETATSQARLIEAVARFDAIHSPNFPNGPIEATLNQLRDAHRNYEGMGETGEFTLGRFDSGEIIFLLSHRHDRLEDRESISLGSEIAVPMQRALAGESGTLVGLDYRGVRVLAAFEPVAELGFGIVAKIDLAEVRRPFVRAGLVCAGIGLALVFIGAVFIIRVTNPLIEELVSSVKQQQEALERVKQLSGLLPICASCKKIQDDSGSWGQIETYIRDRSEANFSHSICPECSNELYSDFVEGGEQRNDSSTS